MSAEKVHSDGELPAALAALEDAIHALCGPQTQYVDGQLLRSPSRYLQLHGATEGEQSNVGGGGGSKSRPPFWCDAFDLRNEIDTAVEVWQPAFTGVPPTVGRLSWIARRNWRPMDCRRIEQISSAVLSWVREMNALLDPPRRWSLPSPCPSCAASVVYRRDSGGELIRQPALQIGPDGCVCAKCRAEWGPQKFLWLANLLGFDKPAGLLE